MKMIYENPQIEIIPYNAEDIVSTNDPSLPIHPADTQSFENSGFMD